MLLDEVEAINQEAIRRTSINLSDEERFGVYFALKVIKSRDGAIQKEDKILIASLLNIGIRTVERIWKDANKQIAEGHEVVVASKRKGRVGRKRKDLDLSRASTIPLNRRRTVRAITRSLGIPRSTLHRRFKLGELKRVSSTVKPYLKPKNRIARLKFCISMLDELWISTPCPLFKPMTDMIHIDEKWFDMTRVKNTYYLLPHEPTPERPVPNSNCIGKVMFLTVVAKPRYNDDGEVIFDGKIGTWAFVEEKAAVRTSQNRARGTIELKNVKVTRNVMRDYLCNKVIPAIQDKWPDEDIGRTIFIQQDNAKPHVLPNDVVFQEAVAQTNLDIRLLQQPPNNPDMNVLDLCLHNSL
ncbi:putative transposase [Hordeum vulgare]|nr:putative transposase [Hordeum vulgare]